MNDLENRRHLPLTSHHLHGDMLQQTLVRERVKEERLLYPADFHPYRSKMNSMFEALSCPTRRKVLECLAMRIHRPTEIAAGIGVSPPTVIYHIRRLREAGLAESHFHEDYDYVNPDAVKALVDYMNNRLQPT